MEQSEIKIQNSCSGRLCANKAWDMLKYQHMETETKTERAKERDWPNINTTHAVLWPSTQTHTHTQAAAAKITLTCPHFHLHSSMTKSTLFLKQRGCQKRGQGSKSPLTGSMDSPGGRWHSAMTGPCLGLNRNMWCQNEKKAWTKKHKRERGSKKKDFKRLWQMKPASMSVSLHVPSCTCLKHVYMPVPYPVQHLVLWSAT